MGKAKPVDLPSGSSWSKVGDAKAHFKAMLARYRDGARITDPSDHGELAALLEVYDSVLLPGEPTKGGAGVSHFERRKDKDHPGHTSCFFVVRVDGTSIDFSMVKAVEVAGGRPVSSLAMVSKSRACLLAADLARGPGKNSPSAIG